MASHRWDVVGVGANSVDEVCVLPGSVHALGTSGKMPIRERRLCFGGQTATTLSSCAAFGLRACYVGVFGSDAGGQNMRRALEERGVEIGRSTGRDVPNASAVILVDGAAGDRIVLWDRSERLRLEPDAVPADLLTSARIVHVDDVNAEAAIRAATIASAAGVPVTSDIDRVAESTEALIAAVRYPIFDQRVPQELTGIGDPERALRKLRRLNSGTLCMTLGRGGAMALAGDRVVAVPGFPVDAVDTTGAGDVFRAGFIYGLLQGWDIEATLRFANAAAAVSCTRLGAISGVPSLQEVCGLVV